MAGIDLNFLTRRPHSHSRTNIMATLNSAHHHVLAGLTTALALSFGAVSQAGAADLACKPTIIVTNSKGASIKVLAFDYKVAGKEETENLSNKRLAVGETEEWKSVKLQHAATGIDVTSTRIQFKNDNSGAGDGYGPVETSNWINRPYFCTDGHTYPHTITVSD
jgi:hypothetical protein